MIHRFRLSVHSSLSTPVIGVEHPRTHFALTFRAPRASRIILEDSATVLINKVSVYLVGVYSAFRCQHLAYNLNLTSSYHATSFYPTDSISVLTPSGVKT